jgi:hypothetical protein
MSDKCASALSYLTVCAAIVNFQVARAADPSPTSVAAEISSVTVGQHAGDFRGDDHRTLQAAVDYVAGLGGGTVRIEAGQYRMRNALILRNNVRIVGQPGQTVLVACDGIQVRLTADGDCNERAISVDPSTPFQIGDGVVVRDDEFRSGFTVTTATVTASDGNGYFRISGPLYLDYMVSRNASASLAFPVVGGWQVKNASLEGLTIEGNREHAEYVDGCRAGGIYLFECQDVSIRNCVVRDYNGDGISFQVSQRVTVEDCLCQGNAGLGLHPGSGSQHPIVRRNRSIDNGGDGLYVCWRVKHGEFTHNQIQGNGGAGLSIGHKDTDNVFRNNTFQLNQGPGILFRNESLAMAAHRNVFEDNRVVDNGLADGDPPILIRGPHHDLVFRRNTIGRRPRDPAGPGIVLDQAQRLTSEDNEFVNVAAEGPILTSDSFFVE